MALFLFFTFAVSLSIKMYEVADRHVLAENQWELHILNVCWVFL